MTKKLILDCDPGHDDALAILLAAKHFDIIGITTVYGNQSIEKTTKNTLKILEFSGLTHIPVYKGSGCPIVGDKGFHYAPAVHGETGLDGPDLPDPSIKEQPENAIDFIISAVMKNDDVTLVPMAPLTNIALALRKEPRIVERISEISLMGGSVTYGNITPAAEFNIYPDPEAAHIVFESGIPIKMVGLNLTRQAAATPAIRARLRSLGNRTGRISAEIMDFYSKALQELFGIAGGSVHDACAVAWLIDPSLITSEKLHVEIELNGTLTRGMTVCDRRYVGNTGTVIGGGKGVNPGKKPNADVGMMLDVERFFDLLINTIGMYP